MQAHPVRSAELHSAPSHNYFAIFLTARDRILERIVCSFYSPLNRTLLTVIAFYALFRAFGLPRGPHAAQVHYFDTSISKYLFCPRYFSRLSQLTLSDLPFQLFQSIISYCWQNQKSPPMQTEPNSLRESRALCRTRESRILFGIIFRFAFEP